LRSQRRKNPQLPRNPPFSSPTGRTPRLRAPYGRSRAKPSSIVFHGTKDSVDFDMHASDICLASWCVRSPSTLGSVNSAAFQGAPILMPLHIIDNNTLLSSSFLRRQKNDNVLTARCFIPRRVAVLRRKPGSEWTQHHH
jgi:hypothetical protein